MRKMRVSCSDVPKGLWHFPINEIFIVEMSVVATFEDRLLLIAIANTDVVVVAFPAPFDIWCP
jgi:hypothetical protein